MSLKSHYKKIQKYVKSEQPCRQFLKGAVRVPLQVTGHNRRFESTKSTRTAPHSTKWVRQQCTSQTNHHKFTLESIMALY